MITFSNPRTIKKGVDKNPMHVSVICCAFYAVVNVIADTQSFPGVTQ